jgi:hypothetical protein
LPYLVQYANDRASKPLSEVIPEEISEWVELQKPALNEIEGDVRDGKRRVSATKGPRKKANRATPAQSDGDDISDGSGSEVEG